MVSKSQIKLITSLSQKKYRMQHSLFVVEGIKGINEFLNSNLELHSLYTTGDYFINVNADFITNITDIELKKVSFLNTPQKALAIFNIPENNYVVKKGLRLALDDVRDPGNLGTIIRLCDWFGITQLLCSRQTVDCYNPKVVQATMGSLTRVEVIYTDLHTILGDFSPIYGAFMDGKNVYNESLS
ncbi:MAG: TrmH family RNA methyltransferase, partial [Leeuwenhoekiella sp.]